MAKLKKMTLKKWEKTAADERMDKRLGFKEGSRKDNAVDRKAVAAANKKRGK